MNDHVRRRKHLLVTHLHSHTTIPPRHLLHLPALPPPSRPLPPSLTLVPPSHRHLRHPSTTKMLPASRRTRLKRKESLVVRRRSRLPSKRWTPTSHGAGRARPRTLRLNSQRMRPSTLSRTVAARQALLRDSQKREEPWIVCQLCRPFPPLYSRSRFRVPLPHRLYGPDDPRQLFIRL